ncbi:MAG TPA: hypothetical protein VKM55_21655 [Candidatus Lokiarchaeia archaeon]|nr:hypothetical protein [Candidatus Lokiarchaeia archaeon]
MKITTHGIVILFAWIALYSILIILYLQTQTPYMFSFGPLARIFALMGITSLFNASFISAFSKQASKAFGVKFLNVHHFFAIAGFSFITLHFLTIWLYEGILTVYSPSFLGGGTVPLIIILGTSALAIVCISLISILVKNLLKKYWRFMHSLIYIALVIAVIHGSLIGEDLTFNPVIFAIILGLLVFLGINFAYKRYTLYSMVKSRKAVQ